MTSAILQCIAIITMMIDHIGYKLFPGVDFLRMIGRLAFPTFVFMLTEGFVHTSSRKKYFLRLGIFALVSELPYQMFAWGNNWEAFFRYWLPTIFPNLWENVFFELLIIFAALWFLDLAKKKGAFLVIGIAGAVGMVALSYVMDTMYGVYGVLMGICFYLFRDKRWLVAVSLVVLTVGYCALHNNWLQVYAVVAAAPIYLYNGQRGQRLPKYFAYVFYPLHLLAICGLYLLIV